MEAACVSWIEHNLFWVIPFAQAKDNIFKNHIWKKA